MTGGGSIQCGHCGEIPISGGVCPHGCGEIGQAASRCDRCRVPIPWGGECWEMADRLCVPCFLAGVDAAEPGRGSA